MLNTRNEIRERTRRAALAIRPTLATIATLGALAILVIVSLAAQPARGQGSRKDDVVFNTQGRPMAGATVRVCTSSATGQPCSPLANIYSDNALTQALANPATSDGLGNYSFYAAPGRYLIEISGPGITTKQIANVILPNDPSSPTFTTITTTTGINAFSLALTGNLTVAGSAAVTGSLTVNGSLAIAGGLTFAGPKPWVDNNTLGALNNGTTDDATANTNCVNGLATNGGTCLIGNNSVWTPPASWTAPSYYSNVQLGGQTTIKTNPLRIVPNQVLNCSLPMLQSNVSFFTYRSGCDIYTTTPVPSTILQMGTGNGTSCQGIAESVFNVRVQDAGTSSRGIFDCSIDGHFENVFSIAASASFLPYESAQRNDKFGHYFEGGGFEAHSGSTNPSMLFHTTNYGGFYETFLNGNGITDETTLYPSVGAICGLRTYYNMLYENAPAYNVANGAFHTYDLTGCSFVNETYINDTAADAADARTPFIDLFGGGGVNRLANSTLVDIYPSGPFFRTPADRQTYALGINILGGYSNTNILGLNLSNSYYNILNRYGALFSQGTAATGVAIGQTGVGVPGPNGLACTASNSGGSLPAGTYWVIAAYEDTESSPQEGQLSDEQGPLTTTGSSGSVSCTWIQSNPTVTPAAAVAATRLFLGTGQAQENQRFRTTTVGGPYVITTATGTSAVPVQNFPDPETAALSTHWGLNGDWTGTEGCFAVGKQGCTSDTTPGDVQITGKVAIGGGLSTAFSTKSSNYTLTASDAWVNVTGTTTITAPHALVGQRWDVFNSGSGTVTVQADSGNVNGAANITLAANTGKSVLCDGSNCFAH